jgi:toxin ParE1/3/4
MKRILEIRPAARREFDEASDWYRDEDPVLRDRFVSAVEKTITDLTQTPLVFPVVFGSAVHRATVKRFPYSIFFTVDNDLVVVLSIS